jgi:nucleoside phosphorylase
LDVQISQPKDCTLTSVNVDVAFQSQDQDCQSATAQRQLGPIITEYFGPKRINGEIIDTHGITIENDASFSLGQRRLTGQIRDDRELSMVSLNHEREWRLHGCSWPLAEDRSGLHRRVKWSVEDAVACEGLRLAVVLQHDMRPFSIAVRIDGRLQGEKSKIFRFFRPAEQGNTNSLSCTVTPSGTHTFPLDEIASRLNSEMTILNIQNYQSAAKMFLQRGAGSRQTTLCVEKRTRSNIAASDTGQHLSVRTKFTHNDYTVAWICALPIEMAAAEAMLDEVHPSLAVHPSDTNQYTLGRIGDHKIVLACLPNGVYGTTSAAIVATHLLYTFNRIRVALMVGIGGGVPSNNIDIRLGDVVVSSPTKQYGGVIQYDFGTNNGDGIQMTGVLNKPQQSLLNAIAVLRTKHLRAGSKVVDYVGEMLSKSPTMRLNFTSPGPDQDQLFKAEYDHVDSTKTCEECDHMRVITRPPRKTSGPAIHYGLIASGNQVMRHGLTRDQLAHKHGILCFEMEAAGLMDNLNCLVVRGICDYADTHKNKGWQGYAAATAAAFAKELLSVVSVTKIHMDPVAAPPANGTA